MTFFVMNLLLALLWASLQQFRPIDFLTGYVLGYAILWLTQNWLGADARRYVRWILLFIAFIGYYIGELVGSTVGVVRALFRDQSTLRPGIIAVPLDARTELEIVLLNNLLSLTPGTLGVKLSPDRSTLYVHVIDVPDPDEARARIKTRLERKLLGVLR